MDSWSKGDYSRVIREASMVVEKLPVVILPSGRVPGRVLLVLPILEAAAAAEQRWDREKRSHVSRVTGDPLNIGQSRASGGSRGAEAPPRRGPGGARPQGTWGPCGPPRLPFGSSVVP